MRPFTRSTSIAVTVILVAGCAAHKPRTEGPESSGPVNVFKRAPAEPGSLSEYMEKVRHLSANARPVGANDAVDTLESRDSHLAADLLLLSTAPTAERHRTVAERYRERGVLDAAYRHFNQALALNPRDAAAYEGLARVWRDWGLPHLALGDAHRATFYAPQSAAARNTYGTILQALGQYDQARNAYELASWLDPQAGYAVNNLCYLAFVRARFDSAIDACRTALRLDPSLDAARNNLALVFAASGRLDLARTQFLDAGDRASGFYNTGIAYLAAGDQSSALAAFDAASRARPTFTLARERARLIRERMHAGGLPGPVAAAR